MNGGKTPIRATSPRVLLWLHIGIAFFIGIVVFLIVVGIQPLFPSNILWLSGNIDPTTNYLGWAFFRDSPWDFPIGLNPRYGLDLSSSIVYSDSIPLLAILFKIITFALPESFQYFGLWYLFCFILQAWFAGQLIRLISPKIFLQLAGSCLIVFSPIFLFRIGIHAALTGQFLILAGLYLNLRPNVEHRIIWWPILLVCATGIHFYLLTILFGLWVSDIIDRLYIKNIAPKAVLTEGAIVLIGLALFSWQFGYFISNSEVKANGFGIYKINLLSIFDAGGWSYLLPDLPNGFDAGESFSFLGLGVILLLLIALGQISEIKKIGASTLRSYPCLIALLLGFTIFALSNHIDIGAWSIAYPLPNTLINFANTLRSSGRLFWPVFYALVLFILCLIIRGFSYRKALTLLLFALIIQIIDTSAGWLPKRIALKKLVENASILPLNDPFWKTIPACYQRVIRVPIGNSEADWSVFAYFANQYHLATNSVFLARIEGQIPLSNQSLLSSVINDKLDTHAIYIIGDAILLAILPAIDYENNLLTRIDGYNVLLPNVKQCKNPISLPVGSKITPADLTPTLNKTVSLTQDNSLAPLFLISGWAHPERWGTWSIGPESILNLPSPKETSAKYLILELRALVASSWPTQTIEIHIDHQYQQTFILTNPLLNTVSIPIPVNSIDKPFLQIEMRYPSRVQPQKLGLGNDSRELAIGIISARYTK